MKRLKIITLLLTVAAFSFSQTNATFNNLDVRNTTKMRGIIYPFGAVATSPLIPATHEILMVNNSTFAMCRMDFQEFADSIANYLNPIIGTHWARTGNYLYPINITDSIGIGTATPTEMLDVQNGNINLDTTSATSGQIKQAGVTVFHTFQHPTGGAVPVDGHNLFLGLNAGNFTLGGASVYTEDGSYNVAVGENTLTNAINAKQNVAIGYGAMQYTTDSPYNVAIGFAALANNKTGGGSVAIGSGALASDTSGTGNVAIGNGAMGSNYTGTESVAIGNGALSFNTSGGANIGIGTGSLGQITTQTRNTAIGFWAGASNIGDSNIFIGNKAGYSETGSNKLYIENSNAATPLIYGDFATDSVVINGDLTVTGQIKYDFKHLVAYLTAGTYTPNTVSNTPFKMAPGMTASENDGLTFAGDSLTIITPGDYKLDIALSMYGDNGSDWLLTIKKNGTTYTSGHAAWSSTGANNRITVDWFYYLVGLVAGDDISFYITNEGANDDPVFRAFKIYIEMKPE